MTDMTSTTESLSIPTAQEHGLGGVNYGNVCHGVGHLESKNESSAMSVSNSSGISSISDHGSVSSDQGYSTSDRELLTDIIVLGGVTADSSNATNNNCCITNQSQADCAKAGSNELQGTMYRQNGHGIASRDGTSDASTLESRDFHSQMCPNKKLSHKSEAFILNPQRLLDKLLVACPNTDICEEMLPRSDLQEHLQQRCKGTAKSTSSNTTDDGKSKIWKCPLAEVSGLGSMIHASIRPGEVTTIDIQRGGFDMGLSIVGGIDTPLMCIVIQEVLPTGIAAKDGRLKPGDQILEVNGEDLTSSTHEDACASLNQPHPISRMTVYREKAEEHCVIEKQEILKFSLDKVPGKQIGIKLAKRKNQQVLYILDIVAGSIAASDGRLRKDDNVLEINTHDTKSIAQEQAAHIIKSSIQSVHFVISRKSRPSCLQTMTSLPQYEEINSEDLPTFYPFSHCPQVVIQVTKEPTDCLGVSISGGHGNGHGDCPIYVTNVHSNGCLAKSKKIKRGDILMSINNISLLGLSHNEAVHILKKCSEATTVSLTIIHGIGDEYHEETFIPTWTYWLSLPSICHSIRLVRVQRCSSGGLGFSIIGGCDLGKHKIPVYVKSVVLNSVASKDGRLRSGDMLVEVNGHSMVGIAHSQAVALLKASPAEVVLKVVSWPGTVV